jgi:hypothetical protein
MSGLRVLKELELAGGHYSRCAKSSPQKQFVEMDTMILAFNVGGLDGRRAIAGGSLNKKKVANRSLKPLYIFVTIPFQLIQ